MVANHDGYVYKENQAQHDHKGVSDIELDVRINNKLREGEHVVTQNERHVLVEHLLAQFQRKQVWTDVVVEHAGS